MERKALMGVKHKADRLFFITFVANLQQYCRFVKWERNERRLHVAQVCSR